jgi:hypothetical protein
VLTHGSAAQATHLLFLLLLLLYRKFLCCCTCYLPLLQSQSVSTPPAVTG